MFQMLRRPVPAPALPSLEDLLRTEDEDAALTLADFGDEQ